HRPDAGAQAQPGSPDDRCPRAIGRRSGCSGSRGPRKEVEAGALCDRERARDSRPQSHEQAGARRGHPRRALKRCPRLLAPHQMHSRNTSVLVALTLTSTLSSCARSSPDTALPDDGQREALTGADSAAAAVEADVAHAELLSAEGERVSGTVI